MAPNTSIRTCVPRDENRCFVLPLVESSHVWKVERPRLHSSERAGTEIEETGEEVMGPEVLTLNSLCVLSSNQHISHTPELTPHLPVFEILEPALLHC